jgi:hypothetical protein
MIADKTVVKHIFNLDGGHTITVTDGAVATLDRDCADGTPMHVDITKTAIGKILLDEIKKERL